MQIKLFLDKVAGFLVDPENQQEKERSIAWAVTIITGTLLLGIPQILSGLWRWIYPCEKNVTHELIEQIFSRFIKPDQKNEESQNLHQKPENTVEDLGSKNIGIKDQKESPMLVPFPIDSVNDLREEINPLQLQQQLENQTVSPKNSWVEEEVLKEEEKLPIPVPDPLELIDNPKNRFEEDAQKSPELVMKVKVEQKESPEPAILKTIDDRKELPKLVTTPIDNPNGLKKEINLAQPSQPIEGQVTHPNSSWLEEMEKMTRDMIGQHEKTMSLLLKRKQKADASFDSLSQSIVEFEQKTKEVIEKVEEINLEKRKSEHHLQHEKKHIELQKKNIEGTKIQIETYKELFDKYNKE